MKINQPKQYWVNDNVSIIHTNIRLRNVKKKYAECEQSGNRSSSVGLYPNENGKGVKGTTPLYDNPSKRMRHIAHLILKGHLMRLATRLTKNFAIHLVRDQHQTLLWDFANERDITQGGQLAAHRERYDRSSNTTQEYYLKGVMLTTDVKPDQSQSRGLCDPPINSDIMYVISKNCGQSSSFKRCLLLTRTRHVCSALHNHFMKVSTSLECLHSFIIYIG
eukprot:TRINITY_DN4974_c0_g1_i7.p1 TRINITY_DN4974_c0_g1~~TRINITY_DN4974_c0_g1_i7.p1  ORF type:complete len:220 (-),score=-19.90 TRINITY_DN4974_c0_g1_i7:269-928(-)